VNTSDRETVEAVVNCGQVTAENSNGNPRHIKCKPL